MSSVDASGLDNLADRFKRVEKSSLGDRLKLHNKIGIAIKSRLQAEIGAAGIRNPSHVADRQKVYLGSGGGYTAVRAKDGTTGAESFGAITNYLENGHRIVMPGGFDTGKRTRAFQFYRATKSGALTIARQEAGRFANELAAKLSGGNKK